MNASSATQPRTMEGASRQLGALHVVPALIAPQDSDGRIVLTRKFVDGIEAYRQRWPGDVSVHMIGQGHRDRHLDDVVVYTRDDSSPFTEIAPGDLSWIDHVADGAAVFLVSLVDRNLAIINRLATCGVPIVLITEQNERTRLEIIRAETRNPMLRWRRQWWSHRIEQHYINAVRNAAGVQCNGAPTYEAYRQHNENVLFYLDSRTTRDMLATPESIGPRLDAMRQGRPLRLAFSGRLVPIKGADDLPLVAERLCRLGVEFAMDIIGGGEPEFEQMLRHRVDALKLHDHVRMTGVMDFHSELVPHLRDHVDVFVCCHRQGDPSCTYIETLGCGVPIIGYDNEAWHGMHDRGAAGWLVPMNSTDVIAETLTKLDGNRDTIADAALQACRFAAEHTFEATMDRRVAHLIQCAQSARRVNA